MRMKNFGFFLNITIVKKHLVRRASWNSMSDSFVGSEDIPGL